MMVGGGGNDGEPQDMLTQRTPQYAAPKDSCHDKYKPPLAELLV